MQQLDWECFPHIRDDILDCVIDDAHVETIRALRLTERAARDFIDRRIGQHVVCTVRSFSLSTAIGGIWLDFRNPRVTARVQTIDVCEGSMDRQAQNLAIPSFPNVKYARLLRGGSKSLLLRLIEGATNVTLIMPLASPSDCYKQILPWRVDDAISRSITIVPRYMCPKSYQSGISFPASSQEAAEIAAFADLVGKKPNELPFQRGFISAIRTIDVVDGAAQNKLSGAFWPTGRHVDRFIIAGNEKMTREVVRLHESGLLSPGHRPRIPYRHVSMMEWRRELSNAEWALIESIPDSCWL